MNKQQDLAGDYEKEKDQRKRMDRNHYEFHQKDKV